MIPRGLLLKGKVYAQKALELDGTLAAAHASLGRARLFSDWDWPAAEKEFRRAIELDPNYAVARQWYGIYLSILGQHQEAMARYQRSLDLDPLSPTARLHVGLGWYFARQYGRAIRAFNEILVSDPSYVSAYRWPGVACDQDGQFERGLQACRRARELGDNWMSLASLAYVEAAAGHRRRALLLPDELAELSKQTYVSPYLVAAIHARLGETEHAFEWLERAYQEKSSVLPFLEVHGWFDAVRADRQFADLSLRIGLPGIASGRPAI